ncbi:MAG: flavodoxin domain-containing protein [Desulfobulbus sp.]|nr:flavodoxin domain-containing protein [Desulfobulbus sp.]
MVYGSETGNTRTAAQTIKDILQKEGMDVYLSDAKEVNVATLGHGYDLTLLGSSSRGDIDTIDFPPSFAPVYEQLKSAQLRDKKMAVFGCGDSSKPYFCGAVELLQEKIGDLGGKLIHTPLCIDGDPRKRMANICSWSHHLSKIFQQQLAQEGPEASDADMPLETTPPISQRQ